MSYGPLFSEAQRSQFIEAIRHFGDYHILVVGDLMLDVFIWGDVERISPEAPVPVVEVCQETVHLGGAANVANNVAALGGKVFIAGVVGNDSAGRKLRFQLEDIAVSCSALVTEPERPTTVKTRVIAHNQQVVRFDREIRTPIGQEPLGQMLQRIKELEGDVDCIIISDYGKGVITDAVMTLMRSINASSHTPVLVDPSVYNSSMYHNLTLVTPNHKEACLMSGKPITDENSLREAGMTLLEHLHCDNVLITQGKDGMSLFDKDGSFIHIPTLARRVYDVTGAGDTVIATLALAVAAGMAFREAALLANVAAGMVVGEVGTATISAEHLTQTLESHGCS